MSNRNFGHYQQMYGVALTREDSGEGLRVNLRQYKILCSNMLHRIILLPS